MKPNPADHMDLIDFLASYASRRYGGEREEWLGIVYVYVAAAAEKYDPSKGAAFPTYATANVKWRLMDEKWSQVSGRDTSKNGAASRKRLHAIGFDELWWEHRRDNTAECPVASAIMWEESEAQHRRVTYGQDDPSMAYHLARGIGNKQMAAVMGVSESLMFQRKARIRHGHGVPCGRSFLPRRKAAARGAAAPAKFKRYRIDGEGAEVVRPRGRPWGEIQPGTVQVALSHDLSERFQIDPKRLVPVRSAA